MTARDRGRRTTQTILHSERLQQLYTALLRCRISAKISPGREAILAAVSLELGTDDYLLPQRAGSIVTRLKGSAVASSGKISDESLNDLTQLTLATGMAQGLKGGARPGLVTALASGSAAAGREFTPLLAFASRSKLPIIYMLETVAPQRTQRKVGKPPLPVIIVEGSDPVAILRVLQECARRARQGHGPALIQCKRPTADPLKFLEEYLRERNLWANEWRRKLETNIRLDSRKLRKKQG
ncbi:MAG TPA: thiamine pyrophosphate-dependent enzyme [Terriglobales bacterium]|nr:thiamine pyrophosphate-dependent enzyme [Terriglobales bacterium]